MVEWLPGESFAKISTTLKVLQLIPDWFLNWACDTPTQGGGVPSAAQLGKMME